jgi:uncharacterized RDD family membrane protein YckC
MHSNVRYAGFWVRFFASLLDLVIIGLPVTILLVVIFFIFLDFDESFVYSIKYKFIKIILFFIITVLFWVYWNGKTVGKKLMNIKIVDYDTNSDIDFFQAMVRYFGYFVSTIIFFLGYIMIAFRTDKRALHDLISGTCVIYDD